MKKKRVLFITGTRADYGKIKTLMQLLEKDDKFEVFIFVCGMHLSKQLGSTYDEVLKDGYKNVYVAYSLEPSNNQCNNLGNTVTCLSGYVDNIQPDMIVVHGDRIDPLAGAMVGALKNILVAHIEGGEVSGTIDESIRHAITKLAHVHFVCNEEAKRRLIQLGEEQKRIFVIGSPDIDVMLSDSLPSIEKAMERYDIPFNNYGILMYHPVTTEYDELGVKCKVLIDSVIKSGRNYVVVYPNNDMGSELIINEYRRLRNDSHFRLFPSIRFEYFLTFLKNADFIIGNSSAGVRESGVYGIPAIDVGSRQQGRYSCDVIKNIQHVDENENDIVSAISMIDKYKQYSIEFGNGDSAYKFIETISNENFWNIRIQKDFVDINLDA